MESIYIGDRKTKKIYKWTITDRIANNMGFFSSQIRRYKRLTAVRLIRDRYLENENGRWENGVFEVGHYKKNGKFEKGTEEQYSFYVDCIDSKESHMVFLGTSLNPIELAF